MSSDVERLLIPPSFVKKKPVAYSGLIQTATQEYKMIRELFGFGFEKNHTLKKKRKDGRLISHKEENTGLKNPKNIDPLSKKRYQGHKIQDLRIQKTLILSQHRRYRTQKISMIKPMLLS